MPLKSSAEIMQVITSWLEFIDKKKVCLRDLTVAIKDYFFLLSTYQTLLRFLDPKSLLECNFLNCLLKYDPLIYSRFAYTCYFIHEYACLTYIPLRPF